MPGIRDALARAWRRVAGPALPELSLDPDAEIALHLAIREAITRGQTLATAHAVYGLLQVDAFVAALTKLGGDAAAMESHVLAELDRLERTLEPGAVPERLFENVEPRGRRRATIADVWMWQDRAEAARAAAAGRVDRRALVFELVHGYPEYDLDQPRLSSVVHVVLRNDDYTTMEAVVRVLRDVFALSEPDATAIMQTAHETGKAIVGRFALDVARDKCRAGRALADEHGGPLWLGIEDC